MFYILDGMINGNAAYINEIFIYSAVDKIHIPNHCIRYYYFLEREFAFCAPETNIPVMGID